MAQPRFVVQIDIPSQATDGHYVYTLRIRATAVLGDSWSVQKRYSDMACLHDHLKKRFPQLPLPIFPAKQSISNISSKVFANLSSKASDKTFVQERAKQLNDYFNALLGMPDLVEDPEIKIFLEIDQHAITTAAGVQSGLSRCCQALLGAAGLGTSGARELQEQNGEILLADMTQTRQSTGLAASFEAQVRRMSGQDAQEVREQEQNQERSAERDRLREKYGLSGGRV